MNGLLGHSDASVTLLRHGGSGKATTSPDAADYFVIKPKHSGFFATDPAEGRRALARTRDVLDADVRASAELALAELVEDRPARS